MNTTIPDIRFYDFNFKLIHVENQFLSSNWNICYNDIGTFEAHFDLESDTLPVVMDSDYLVVVQGVLSAIITGKKLGDDLAVFGRTCNWLLTKRVTDAFDATNGAADQLVYTKVQEAFFDSPVIRGDAIPLLPPITMERTEKCETFSFVQECLKQQGLGHEMRFNFAEKEWIFQIRNGNKNNPLVISTVNRNAYDVVMDSDSLNLCTDGWYKQKYQNMGEWDPQVNLLLDSDGNTISGTSITNGTAANPIPSNFAKCWKVRFKQNSTYTSYVKFGVRLYPGDFVVCDNKTGILKKADKTDPFWVKISKSSPVINILRWESLLSGGSESEAFLELNNARITDGIQGKTVGVRFGNEDEYKRNECDYTLGDIVLVEWQSGTYKKRARKRIVGVNLWYETGNIGEEPVFEDVEL